MPIDLPQTISYWLPLGNNVAIGAFLLALAAGSLWWGRDGRVRRRLAAYLFLVALGYILDALGRMPFWAPSGDPLLVGAGKVLGALDIGFFFLFCWELTKGPLRRSVELLCLAPSVALATVLVGTQTVSYLGRPIAYVSGVLYLLGYGTGFGLMAWRYATQPGGALRDLHGLYFAAFALSVLPRLALLYSDIHGFGWGHGPDWVPFATLGGLWAVLVPSVIALSPPPARGEAWRRLALAAGLTAIVVLVWVARLVPGFADAARTQVYSVRWLLFGFVFSWGAGRVSLFLTRPVKVRRLQTAGLVLVGLAATSLGAAVLATSTGFSVAGAYAASGSVVSLAAILPAVMSQWPQRNTSLPADAVYGAHVQGGASKEELEGVRKTLGLTAAEAAAIAHLAQVRAVGALEQGAIIGHYAVQDCIGIGSSGRVFLAWDQRAKVHVALKEFHTDESSARALRGQLAAMQDHGSPHVARLLDIVDWAGRPVLVFEHLDGEDLTSAGRRATSHQAEEWHSQCTHGLQALHKEGLLHGDVKPSNIMITHRGAVLVDAGLLPPAGRTVTLAVGTPGYVRPERWEGAPAGPEDDYYGLAASFLESVAALPHDLAREVRTRTGRKGTSGSTTVR